MLARQHKLVDAREFSFVTRRGRRAGTTTVVVHVACPHHEFLRADTAGDAPIIGDDIADRDLVTSRYYRVGLVVGKKVGNAVTRHQVSRWLRHSAREILEQMEADGIVLDVVIRALPAAGSATHAEIHKDLVSAIGRAYQQLGRGRDGKRITTS